MVWGCFAASRADRLIVIDGINDSVFYLKIQKDNVQLSLHAVKLKHTQVMLQDNDPKHTNNSTSEWLREITT